MDSDAWNQAEPREGPWKITGAGESSSSSPSGWGSVLPGTEGTKQKANVYLMTFLCVQPLF